MISALPITTLVVISRLHALVTESNCLSVLVWEERYSNTPQPTIKDLILDTCTSVSIIGSVAWLAVKALHIGKQCTGPTRPEKRPEAQERTEYTQTFPVANMCAGISQIRNACVVANQGHVLGPIYTQPPVLLLLHLFFSFIPSDFTTRTSVRTCLVVRTTKPKPQI